MTNPAVVLFMDRVSTTPDGEKLYSAASPITHVSSSSPPVLLLHGDSDDTVPFEQSLAMEHALRQVSVPVKLVRVAGGEHGPTFGTAGKPHPDLPRVLGETVTWLDGGRVFAITYAEGSRTGGLQPWVGMGSAKAALESLVRYLRSRWPNGRSR